MLRHVETPDGVRIACEVSGEGPSLVLVHGAGSARWSFDAVRPHLEERFTVIAIDRRGRGDSTDGDGYAVEREYEDVAAVVRDAGEGALLAGHSYGGLVAVGAAGLLDLPRLALYEPAMGGGLVPPGTIDRWERLIESGERDTVIGEFFRDIAGHDEEEIEEFARSPVWEARRRVLPTGARRSGAPSRRNPEPGLGGALRRRPCAGHRALREARPRWPGAFRDGDRAGPARVRARAVLRLGLRTVRRKPISEPVA